MEGDRGVDYAVGSGTELGGGEGGGGRIKGELEEDVEMLGKMLGLKGRLPFSVFCNGKTWDLYL